MSDRDVERAQFEAAFGADVRLVEHEVIADQIAWDQATPYHVEVSANPEVDVTGGAWRPPECLVCGLDMVLRHSGGQRLRSHCLLEPHEA